MFEEPRKNVARETASEPASERPGKPSALKESLEELQLLAARDDTPEKFEAMIDSLRDLENLFSPAALETSRVQEELQVYSLRATRATPAPIRDFVRTTRRNSAQDDFDIRMEQGIADFNRETIPRMAVATRQDYKTWLKGFIKKGGETRDLNVPFSTERCFIAVEDFKMHPLYGAFAVKILVPPGVKCLGGASGHNGLYYMHDHSTSDSIVWRYKDT